MKIRSDILRTYQSLHTWTGIVAGLVLFIGFYAGSLTMFEDELTHWATPSHYHLPQVPTDKLDDLIAKASASSDKVSQGFTINFSDQLSPITWFEQGGGRRLTLDDVKVHGTLSEDGSLVTQTEPANELGNLIDLLHRTAGIAGKLGHEDLGVVVLGVASVLYFLALVSGIIFLLPTLTKSFFALRKDKGANRFWLDSHNLVGVVSLPFHFIIAWTVIVFAFHDVLYDGLSLVYGDEPTFERVASPAVEYTMDDLPPISSYLDKVDSLVDGYHLESIAFSGLLSSRPSVGITLKNNNEMMRNNTGDFIYLHPYNLNVTYSSIPMSDDEYYVSYVASFFSLHFGGFGGDIGRWLYFIMGLLGAFLFYSGNLIWLEKRRKKEPIQSLSNRFMASLTVGVCLGSMLAVAVTLFSSKWLYFFNADINYSYLGCYYFVFFAAVIYSFLRGAAVSAIHIQYASCLACLFIPLTSVASHLSASFNQWASRDFGSVMVDVVAFVFAGIFYFAAKKTKNRALNGERNSIWAI
ncbi:PepSY-associated TM helix domain-containing protein [Paraglaciecola sp. 2405UD69-4]|uniref:PepSY-associated TM helix domain-containing protein n=1 Tax=Paraglaciecola sp. 2405UD69-4 TaxID=3391836 RepID=UPI0039C9E172